MKNTIKLLFGAILLLVSLSAMSFAAPSCDPDVFALSTAADLTCGTPFVLRYSDFGFGTGILNLNFDGLDVISGLNSVDLNTDAFYLSNGYYEWTLNCTTPGTYDLIADVLDFGCSINKALNLPPVVYDPNLTLSLELNAPVVVNNSKQFNVVLNNTGDGNATNVSGSIISATIAGLSNDSVYRSNLENNSVETLSNYYYLPSVCGADTLTLNIQNHYNGLGALMNPVSATKSVTVLGSDLIIDTLDITNLSIKENYNVSVSAFIKNQGTYVSKNANVKFYLDSVSALNLIYELNLTDINVNDNTTVNFVYNMGNKTGTHKIYGIIYSEQECSTLNDVKQSQDFLVNICTPNWQCLTWGACTSSRTQTCTSWNDTNVCYKQYNTTLTQACTFSSGSTGGGGSVTLPTDVVLKETVTFDLNKPAEVKLSLNEKVAFKISGQSHSLTVSRVSASSATLILQSNPVVFTLSIGEARYFDLDNNYKNDLFVKLNAINNGAVDVTIKQIIEETTLPEITEKVNETVIEKPVNESKDVIEVKEETISPSETTVTVIDWPRTILVVLLVLAIVGVIGYFVYLSNKKHHNSKNKE